MNGDYFACAESKKSAVHAIEASMDAHAHTYAAVDSAFLFGVPVLVCVSALIAFQLLFK